MRIIEERTKKIMITTRLEVEMWKEACDHAVWLSNLLCPAKLAGPDGHGPRPLELMSKNNVTRNECDRRRTSGVLPGTLCYVEVPKGAALASKGSDIDNISRVRWARAIGNEAAIVVFQCPYHLRDNRHIFRSRNYSEIELPPGMSALEFLGLPEPPLPRVCLPREGDAAENG